MHVILTTGSISEGLPELPQAPGEFQGRTGSFSGYQYTSQGLGS